MKVRKKVTLMAVTVTAIFGVCYLSDCTINLLEHYASKQTAVGDVEDDVNSALIMLNSAINPIVCVLVNQRFKEKIKGMICCICRPANNRIREIQRLEIVNRATDPHQETG